MTILKKEVANQERLDGPEGQSVAATLGELGITLRYLKEYQDSEVAFRRALLIRQRYLGQTHPRFASHLLGIGRLYFEQNGNSQAEDLFKRARDIFQSSFGPDSVPFAQCNGELGRVYLSAGRLEEAEGLLRGAVGALEARLTLAHPETVRALRSLAKALRMRAKDADADGADRRAAEGMELMDKTAVIDD